MIIRTLAENTSLSEAYGHEHGLSFYIETKEHKILFDAGGSDLFAKNAEKMGVDLSAVDIAFISHGHYDHGGGLSRFLELNSNASVYVHQRAFEGHYAFKNGGVKTDIGLPRELLDSGRIILTGDRTLIDEELSLFAGVEGSGFRPSGNSHLLMEKDGELVLDDFRHEQNLAVQSGGSTVLFAGCAHNGITNILERFRELHGRWPDHVVGGFHLQQGSTAISEDKGTVRAIGSFLKGTGTLCHTCHCTGLESYKVLEEVLDGSIDYLSAGSLLKVDQTINED